METYTKLRLARELIRLLRAIFGLIRTIIEFMSVAINYQLGAVLGGMDSQIRVKAGHMGICPQLSCAEVR